MQQSRKILNYFSLIGKRWYRRSRCGGGRKSLALSEGFSLKSPWGLEWRLTMHLYSSNPLPLEAAIPKCLLLNIVPAFQTARRASAVYTGSWIFTSHTPNMVSPAAYQPMSTGGKPAVCTTNALRLTLSWKAEWKPVWLLVAADSLVINNHNSSQHDVEARIQSPFQIAVFVDNKP